MLASRRKRRNRHAQPRKPLKNSFPAPPYPAGSGPRGRYANKRRSAQAEGPNTSSDALEVGVPPEEAESARSAAEPVESQLSNPRTGIAARSRWICGQRQDGWRAHNHFFVRHPVQATVPNLAPFSREQETRRLPLKEPGVADSGDSQCDCLQPCLSERDRLENKGDPLPPPDPARLPMPPADGRWSFRRVLETVDFPPRLHGGRSLGAFVCGPRSIDGMPGQGSRIGFD